MSLLFILRVVGLLSILVLPTAAAAKDHKAATASTDQPASAASAVTVRVHGADVALGTAQVHNRGGEALIFLLHDDEPLPCEGLNGIMKGEPNTLTVGARPTLQPDGSSVWTADLLMYNGHKPVDTAWHQALEVTVDETKITVNADFEASLGASMSRGRPATSFKIAQTFSAMDCGTQRLSAAPPSNPQGALTATIAGKSLAFKSAQWIEQGPLRALRLSTQPLDCDDATSKADVGITITYKPQANKAVKVTLEGQLLAAAHSDFGAASSIVLVPSDAAEGVVKGTLKGEFELDGYAVT
ncbi:MAG: hypothetical protein ACI9MC_003887, partial [Kiritimatiellia bacterium]